MLAVADELAQGVASQKTQLINYADTCYPPAYSYFKETFDTNNLKDTVGAIKAACYFLPCKIDELKPTARDLDSLKYFTLIDPTLNS